MAHEGKFVWYELVTTDAAAAASFYASVVGWEAEPAPQTTAGGEPYTVLRIPGAKMGSAGIMTISADMAANGARPAWIGYIGVENVDAMTSAFTGKGGKVLMPPMDIPEIGRFSVVSDPQGAIIYLFTPRMPAGGVPEAPKPGTPGTVGWHELYAADGPEAFAFYAGQFGWVKSTAMDMGAMGVYQLFAFASDGPDVGAVMTKMANMPQPFWNYYFNVGALDPAVEAIGRHGGSVINGPMEVPGGSWIVQAVDPQGAMFSLVAPKR